MKNREVRVFIASMMLVSLVAGSLSGAPVYTPEQGNVTITAVEYAGAENKETAKTVSEKKSSQDTKASSAKPTKEETVYAKIDGSGSVRSVTVSDQLKNISDRSKLEDISDLQDIINVKGDEAFSAMGSNVVWDTADEDICYQGTTTKELPVGIRISYKLDGKDISAANLKGKSGHVTIRYTYENKSGSKGKASTPFMMATGLILDEEIFKNVTVENGKLISDGERNMVIGYGLPAMKNILGIEDKDLDIPDYFQVEADVTEYEPAEGLTIATNSIFNDLDTKDFDSLDELNDSMDELQDASRQLVSGSGELKNGIDTLLASSGTLTDGIDQLAAGGGELQSGTGELADGSAQILDGSQKLADGSKELADGNAKLADGSKDLADGNAKLAEGSKDLADGNAKLADGTRQLYDGTETLALGAGELNAGLKLVTGTPSAALSGGARQLDAGIGELQDQFNTLAGGLAPQIKNLGANLGKLQTGAKELAVGLQGLSSTFSTLPGGKSAGQSQADSLQAVADQLKSLEARAAGIPTESTGTPNAQILQSAENITANASILEAQLNEIGNHSEPAVISETAEVNPAAAADIASVMSVLSGIATEDESVNSAIQAAIGYAQSAQSNLYTVGGDIVQSGGSSDTAAYTEAARATAQAIAADTNTILAEAAVPSVNNDTAGQIQQLCGEISALSATVQNLQASAQADAGAQMAAAADSVQQLVQGAENLQNGLGQMAAGVQKLEEELGGQISEASKGIAALKEGSAALEAGINGKDGLVSGLNQLSAGAQKLDAGSQELSKKMGEANEGAKSAASGAAKLASGASDAASGASELASGASDAASGASELAAGASDLNAGAFDLAAGANKLNDGALTLKDGLNTLQSGSGALIDGVQQLDDGAAELNDGMIRFDRDGIQKLVDAFGGDVEELLDKMNEMLDASRAYKNFSGIADDMDGEVKFIFVTEE